jgi:hypothetical protein
MKVLFSFCCFLTITSYGLAENVYNRFSEMIEVYEEECKDSKHHYHWYPFDCHKYFSCVDGTLQVLDCPADMNWNEAIRACDVADHVDCSNILPYPDPDCSDGENAYYLYPYDCQKFYECYKGTLYILTCPDDSLWNYTEEKCDESESIDCSHIIPSPDTTTSTVPTKPTTTTAKTTTTTTPKPTTAAPLTTPKIECTYDHQYFPYPYDCSKYYECSNYKAILMECPTGEYWNNDAQTCDWSYNVDCEVSTPASKYRQLFKY